jgi:NAD(P)-dependent dehydrogenase (short-subunit alcohol dehydrogenase family)
VLAPLVEEFGDRVLPASLDLCDRDSIRAAVRAGVARFGAPDVVINNAGYGMFCPVEEIPECEASRIIETNLLGSLRVIQEVLPVLRERGRGHIVQISSIAGLISLPGMGMYNATKWGVEGLVEALAQEVRTFGVRVTLVEPGPHDTDWIGTSAVRPKSSGVYPSEQDFMRQAWPRMRLADPTDTVAAMLALVDSPEPPLRMLLGPNLDELIAEALHRRADEVSEISDTQGRKR